jgi:hypothetical protein
VTPEQAAFLADLMAKKDALGPEPLLPPKVPEVVLPDLAAIAPPPGPPRKRPQLYSPARRGYRRASRMPDGIDDQIRAMKEAATNPFHDLEKPVEAPPAQSKGGHVLELLRNRVVKR